jgi:hypothetical protein
VSENGAYPGCWGPELLDKPISKCPCLELLGILCFHEAEISNKYAEVYHAKHHLSNISTYSMYIAYVYIHQYRYIYIYIHTYVSGWLYRYLYYIKMIKNCHDDKKHKKKVIITIIITVTMVIIETIVLITT